MRDEQPAEQRHREWLDQPVDADRYADAAAVLADLAQRGRVDFEQHGYDHEPNQHRSRQIDLRDRRDGGGIWNANAPSLAGELILRF